MDVELQEESELDLGLLPMEDKGFQFDLESQGRHCETMGRPIAMS